MVLAVVVDQEERAQQAARAQVVAVVVGVPIQELFLMPRFWGLQKRYLLGPEEQEEPQLLQIPRLEPMALLVGHQHLEIGFMRAAEAGATEATHCKC